MVPETLAPVRRRLGRSTLLGLYCDALIPCLQLNAYIKSTVHSANALVGSCKMGHASDKMAVVDSALKVRQKAVAVSRAVACAVDSKGYKLRSSMV